MAVQGVGYWISAEEPRSLHILVTGDDRLAVRTLRDEEVSALAGDHATDLAWQVDQYTQETIGVTLAAEGWEVFSTAQRHAADERSLRSSPIYLVRR